MIRTLGLLFLIAMSHPQSISGQTIRITLLSKEAMLSTKAHDLPAANVKLYFRIKNDSSRDVYLIGSKYDNEFDVLLHLLRFDIRTKSWMSPPGIDWGKMSEESKVRLVLRKNSYYDFYLTTSRGSTDKKFKVLTYAAYSKNGPPLLLESDDFVVSSK